MMGNVLTYKGYHSRVEYSVEDRVLHGKIEGITDLVTFESESAELIENEFKAAVDDYLSYCAEVGKAPEKEYGGTFNIRISPAMHKQLALYSLKNNTSINSSVDKAIKELLAKDDISNQFGEDDSFILTTYLRTTIRKADMANLTNSGSQKIIKIEEAIA